MDIEESSMKLMKIAVASLLLISFLAACASTTMLKSTPAGAKFYADGHYLGEGSVSYTDKKIVGSTTVIEVKKEGFKDKVASISRSAQLNAGALVGGILLSPTVLGLLFFLWVMDYSPYYVFDLEPNNNK
jgi:hypothetical protein